MESQPGLRPPVDPEIRHWMHLQELTDDGDPKGSRSAVGLGGHCPGLDPPELRVDPVPSDQFVMGALFDHSARIENVDAIRMTYRRKAMGDDDRGPVAADGRCRSQYR